MIIIAGPNGSGKTIVTQKFLHHEWSEGILYINPDQIASDNVSVAPYALRIATLMLFDMKEEDVEKKMELIHLIYNNLHNQPNSA